MILITKRHQSYNIFQGRCEENVVEIIKRYFNSCHVELQFRVINCYKFWVDYNLE